MIVEGPDGLEYGFTADVAERLEQVGIVNAEHLITQWKTAGILTPTSYAGRRPIYRMVDVYAAELTARKKAATRRGGRRRLTSI